MRKRKLELKKIFVGLTPEGKKIYRDETEKEASARRLREEQIQAGVPPKEPSEVIDPETGLPFLPSAEQPEAAPRFSRGGLRSFADLSDPGRRERESE